MRMKDINIINKIYFNFKCPLSFFPQTVYTDRCSKEARKKRTPAWAGVRSGENWRRGSAAGADVDEMFPPGEDCANGRAGHA